jgi:arginyl-tRNA synthetase
MQTRLKEKTAEAINDLYQQQVSPEQVLINIPPREFPHDFTIVIFPFSKMVKRSPDQVATEVGKILKEQFPEIGDYEVVKGFLNIKFKDEYWIGFLNDHYADDSFGSFPATGKKILIEYSGPNTNKPLHFGHLRNIFIGWSVSQIEEAAGNEVIKANIYNNRGVHICKSMLAYKKLGNGETPDSSGKKGDHLVGEYYVRFENALRQQMKELMEKGLSEEEARKKAPLNKEVADMLLKWEKGDPEVRALWEMMNEWVYRGFDETYGNIGVSFDQNYYESETYTLGKAVVEEGLQKGIFFKKPDGSAWVDLTDEGLDEKLLLRADGTSVYITQDLGTADLRYRQYKPDTMVYTVASEQDYHFKVLKLVCKKLGRPYADSIYHLSYGLVDLPTGRMKTREGTAVDADDMIKEMDETSEEKTRQLGKIENFSAGELKKLYHMIGMGALKFFLLKVDPKKRMIFNPEESIDFHGFTGPFIQYTHARIKSVLRKAEANKISYSNTASVKTLDPKERQLILQLNQYPSMIAEAASGYAPSAIANYVYHLAKDYNQFYAELPILNADDEVTGSFRLKLSAMVASVIKKSMKLLGIDVPERM